MGDVTLESSQVTKVQQGLAKGTVMLHEKEIWVLTARTRHFHSLSPQG